MSALGAGHGRAEAGAYGRARTATGRADRSRHRRRRSTDRRAVRPTRRSRRTSTAAPLPPGEKVFLPVPDRWNLQLPEWDRYGVRGDYPYVSGHWWDPYNQNRLKGDYPVIGKRTFFTFTGISDSLLEGRNLPVPSGVSTAAPGQRDVLRARRHLSCRSRPSGRRSICSAATPCSARSTGACASRRPTACNFVNLSEFNGVNADVRRKRHAPRSPRRHPGAFVEKKLFDIEPALRLPVGARRHPGVHVRLPRLPRRCSKRRASACSAR